MHNAWLWKELGIVVSVLASLRQTPYLDKKAMIDQLKAHIQNREIQQMLELIHSNPEVLDATDDNGVTGLLWVAYSNDPVAFEEAKTLKQSFNFYEAIVCGKLDMVRSYLNQNATLLNKYSPDGFTPIALAAFFMQPAVAEFLLTLGADPNLAANNPSKVNALHAAVARGQLELVQQLIKYGANVNAVQAQGVTPLHSAAHQGNLPMVQLLVENGADRKLKMDNGEDALSMARQGEFTAVADYLTEADNHL